MNPKTTKQSSPLFTIREAADYLKVSDSTMWRWVREGRIPTVSLGRLRRVRLDDLESTLKKAASPHESASEGLHESFPSLTPQAGIFQLIGIFETGLPDIGEKHDLYAARRKNR